MGTQPSQKAKKLSKANTNEQPSSHCATLLCAGNPRIWPSQRNPDNLEVTPAGTARAKKYSRHSTLVADLLLSYIELQGNSGIERCCHLRPTKIPRSQVEATLPTDLWSAYRTWFNMSWVKWSNHGCSQWSILVGLHFLSCSNTHVLILCMANLR